MEKGMEITTSKVENNYSLPSGEEFNTMVEWSKMMNETKYYQKLVAEGGKFAIMALFAAARDLKISPFLAINGALYIVSGRVMVSSQTLGLLIRRSGHSVKKITGSPKLVTLKGTRADNGDTAEVTYTWEMAERAGLTKNATYSKFPETMLYNRALSMLAKQLFQDAIGGNLLVEGEIVEAEVEEVNDVKPVDKEEDEEVKKFMDEFNLHEEGTPMLAYIDSIAESLSLAGSLEETRIDVIRKAMKDKEKFIDAFMKYDKKQTNK